MSDKRSNRNDYFYSFLTGDLIEIPEKARVSMNFLIILFEGFDFF